MSKFYQEITLIDQAEISPYFLWSKVYTQLHIAFAEHKDENEKIPFGISFPQYGINVEKKKGVLGSKIRVFAHSENELRQLNLTKWLERLTDYVHITQPKEVPRAKITGYAHFYRVNPKLNLEERIVHQSQRLKISLDQARNHFKEYKEQPIVEPYINLKSLSAKREKDIDQLFRLYIGRSVAEEATDGKFGTYGLSRTIAVPEF